MSQLKLVGSLVALVTPMTNKGEVDYNDLDHLVDLHLANGTSGIVILGTTAESVTLSDDEKEKISCRVTDRVAGRIPVIIGSGSNCTKKTILETQRAKNYGADAVLVVTPYYNKPTQEGLLAHYRTLAQSVDIPIILYNVPGRTACDLKPETTAKLAAEPNIIGLKEANADPNRIKELVALCPQNFSLLSGEDGNLVEYLTAGGHGIISVTANVVPQLIADICSAAQRLDFTAASKINLPLQKLHSDLFISSNPMPVKWVLYYLELIHSDFCRLPLLPLESKYHADLIAALEQAGMAKTANQINIA